MTKLETLLKVAQAYGLKNDDGTPITTEMHKLNIDMNKLCPKARAEVYRHIAEANDEVRRRLEDQLKALGLFPLYNVYRGPDGKKNVRVYRSEVIKAIMEPMTEKDLIKQIITATEYENEVLRRF